MKTNKVAAALLEVHQSGEEVSTSADLTTHQWDKAIHEAVITGGDGNRKGLINLFKASDPSSKKGKRIQMFKLLFLTMIPIFTLCVLTILDMAVINRNNIIKGMIRDVIKFSTEAGTLVHQLQKERDMTTLHLSTLGSETRMFLKEVYPQVDMAVSKMSKWQGNTKKDGAHFRTKFEFQQLLMEHRLRLKPENTNVYKEIDFYTRTIAVFIDWMYDAIQESRDGDVWRTLVAYQLLVMAKEDLGIERTLGGLYYSKGRFSSYKDYLWWLERHHAGIGNLETAIQFSGFVAKIMEEEKNSHRKNFTLSITSMREEISRNDYMSTNASLEMSTWWFDNMTIYMDMYFKVQVKLADYIMERLGASILRDVKDISVGIGLFMIVLVICPVIIVSVRAIMNDVQRYAFALVDRSHDLNVERQRTNQLLYQLLPKPVAAQLKRNKHVAAEVYDDATVFFSDIVGFTKICSNCSPMQVIDMLNNIYSLFDGRIELYNVYKVETIGDGYMVVSGVPKRNGNKHVYEICMMSLDLMHHITHIIIPHLPGLKMKLRIGVNTGSCVAGVVGFKMPRYCLFGNTVTTASILEQTSLPNKIQMSRSSKLLLDSVDDDFITNKRMSEESELKELGCTETFWLDGKKGFEDRLPCFPACQVVSPLMPGDHSASALPSWITSSPVSMAESFVTPLRAITPPT
ncbi:uncharacterized protein LOC141908568 [Tubulanus polymorphus]|uniref:uncharacterized protein LOC141908568 n=1 Tax=Tubulanus polymorphus TaxID=672921 RepID=UPI003DA2E0F6